VDNIKILTNVEPACEAVVCLYKDAGWWSDDWGVEFIPAMIKGSFCFATAYDGNEVVGMGRAISDGVSDAYIQDIIVLKDYRRRGIGAGIVKALTAFLEARGIDWIALVGEPGTEPFYMKCAFRKMRGYIPMKYDMPGSK
jgi:spermidine synthase